jgi:hypothetical protein
VANNIFPATKSPKHQIRTKELLFLQYLVEFGDFVFWWQIIFS